jgi:hypothetical protein
MGSQTDERYSSQLYVYCTLFAPTSGLSKYIVGGRFAYLNWIVLS